ncbi:hypothetical protein [Sphingomonas sp. MS122]|uniref:hypothetical protein n=1 Tax=Sphingomonas sp. MS122 TaxID=3412683 RepID=UPI003C2D9F4A
MEKLFVRACGAAFALAVSPASAQVAPPAPPPGATAHERIPIRDAAGRYHTPNLGISHEEATWHVRAALNVAALGCRDAYEAQRVAAYNGLLREKHAVLAAADGAVRATYRVRYGAQWQNEHDGAMTRLYNFFAQPPAQRAFCDVAHRVLSEATLVAEAEFPAFAATAIARLEAPFTDFYRDYDAYRLALAEWRAGRVVVAPDAPVVVAAVMPGEIIP